MYDYMVKEDLPIRIGEVGRFVTGQMMRTEPGQVVRLGMSI
jgi:hypothetical protein